MEDHVKDALEDVICKLGRQAVRLQTIKNCTAGQGDKFVLDAGSAIIKDLVSNLEGLIPQDAE